MRKELQPTRVTRVTCPKCGELMVKFYPNSTIGLQLGAPVPLCKKCIAKQGK